MPFVIAHNTAPFYLRGPSAWTLILHEAMFYETEEIARARISTDKLPAKVSILAGERNPAQVAERFEQASTMMWNADAEVKRVFEPLVTKAIIRKDQKAADELLAQIPEGATFYGYAQRRLWLAQLAPAP